MRLGLAFRNIDSSGAPTKFLCLSPTNSIHTYLDSDLVVGLSPILY